MGSQMSFFRLLSLVLLVFVLAGVTACADGGSAGGSDPTPEEPGDDGDDGGGPEPEPAFEPPPAPAVGSLAGRVQKGIMVMAEVTASRWSGDAWVEVDSTLSDAEGHFTLVVGEDPGPVRISARRISGTALICDFTGSNCQSLGTTFGGLFNLPVSLQLDAIIQGGRTGEFITVSPLTHIAASWVELMPGAPTDQKAVIALSRVADILGLPRDFVWHYPIDITASDQLIWASPDALRHAWLTSAIGQDMLDNIFVSSILPEQYFAALANDFAAEYGQLTADWLNTIAALHQPVSQTVEANTGYIVDAALIDAQVALLESYATGLTNTALSAVAGDQDLLPAERFLGLLDGYLRQAGIDDMATIEQRQDEFHAWLSSGADWMGGAVLLDALAHGAVAGFAAPDIVVPDSCEPLENFATELIATGMTDQVPLTLFSEPRPAGYIQLCPATGGFDLQFQASADPYMGQTVDILIGVRGYGVDAGMARFDLVFVEPASTDDSVAAGRLMAGGSISIQTPDNADSRKGMAGLLHLLATFDVDETLEPFLQALQADFTMSLVAGLSDQGGSGRGYDFELETQLGFDAAGYMAGTGPLLQVSGDHLEMAIRGEAAETLFRVATRDVPGVLPLITPTQIAFSRSTTVNGSFELEGFGNPVLQWNVDGISDGLTRWADRLLDYFDALGAHYSTVGEFEFRGSVDAVMLDELNEFPRYQFISQAGELSVSEVVSGEVALSATLMADGRGGYIRRQNTLVGIIRLFYDSLAMAGADLYLPEQAARQYRMASILSSSPPTPPDDSGGTPQ